MTGRHSTNSIGVTPDSHQTEHSGVSQQHVTYLAELLFYPWQNKVQDAPNPGFYRAAREGKSPQLTTSPPPLPPPPPHGRQATNSAPWRGGRAPPVVLRRSGRRVRHVRDSRGLTRRSRRKPHGERGETSKGGRRNLFIFRDSKMQWWLLIPGSLINANYSFSLRSHYIAVKK